jgi:hypothetical protein
MADHFIIIGTLSAVISLLAFGGAVRETWILVERTRHK